MIVIIILSILVLLIVLVGVNTIFKSIKWFIELKAYYTTEYYNNNYTKPKSFDTSGFSFLSILIALYYLIDNSFK